MAYDSSMESYEKLRQTYKPAHIKVLLIAESPPPLATVDSSRHFYRDNHTYPEDRLFINTVKAIYPEAAALSERQLQKSKKDWLQKLQKDGWYMIEALKHSLSHEVTKKERQQLIKQALPELVERVGHLVQADTKIILIKSNVFEVAATPLKHAGFTILNTALLDYPGRYNQHAYREKLAEYALRLA